MADSKLLVGASRFPFYVVGRGLRPDVYRTWRECYANTHGIKGNRFKGFYDYDKARSYVRSLYKVLYRRKVGDKFGNMSTSRGRVPNASLPVYNQAVQAKRAELLALQIENMILEQKFLPSAM